MSYPVHITFSSS